MKLLDSIQKLGNRLPDPSVLFIFGTILVFILSMIISELDITTTSAASSEVIINNLLTSHGIWWFLSSMVDNFISFPPLGIVCLLYTSDAADE